MSMTTSGARLAVTRINGGLTTEHYASVFEMVEQVLCSSGDGVFRDFLTLVLPRVIQRWKRGREADVIMDADTDRLLHDYELLSGCEMIANERFRQINREGWTPEHDDQHILGEIAAAAACYAMNALDPEVQQVTPVLDGPPPDWPWDAKWWKPTNPMRDLQKAGALIAAELDRLQRIEARQTQKKEKEEEKNL